MARLIKTSFQIDEQTFSDVRAEAEERGEMLSVVVREWLRMGRDEARRRKVQFEQPVKPADADAA
ncbi:MAG: hypothetical protein M1337_08940 [Actinobacteria bacterium]|nr:hypothetical protein [Actinomycetota bacterium]